MDVGRQEDDGLQLPESDNVDKTPYSAMAQFAGSIDNHWPRRQGYHLEEPDEGGYSPDIFLHGLDPRYCYGVCLSARVTLLHANEWRTPILRSLHPKAKASEPH